MSTSPQPASLPMWKVWIEPCANPSGERRGFSVRTRDGQAGWRPDLLQAVYLAKDVRDAVPDAFVVELRTSNQSTGPRRVKAIDGSQALRQAVGFGAWPEPSVIVLTLGEPSPGFIRRELQRVADLAYISHSRTTEPAHA